ncbi:transporter substrate-binding domain-containing protein [Aliiglaciecola sp. CAU 1673]|uniref:transporter substrate-binding domain-containing protein n=1 Tax=Aliiglaciecola sp. CAU 1673 TaxID=3032595 RepID=UPI0023DBCBDE|nr:transporter substrate-binding domain-containing protein [Aliiglaciecola sp. CAU 1673]MDF2177454.1 transporter substrate-binding domain-containing protein [Aliiglaciecola sp. CAU 1673]
MLNWLVMQCKSGAWWWFFLPLSAIAAERPDIAVLVNLHTQTELSKPQGKFARASIDKLKRFMEASTLSYEIVFLPWPRAMDMLASDDSSLIFELLRTPQREDQYHWILPLYDSGEMQLIARSDSPFIEQTKAQWLGSDHQVACTRASAQCSALRRFGFTEKHISIITSSSPTILEQMLMQNRVDFIPGFMPVVHENLASLGFAKEVVKGVAVIDNSVDYLAAPKHLKGSLLKRLLETPQEGLPSLNMACESEVCR